MCESPLYEGAVKNVMRRLGVDSEEAENYLEMPLCEQLKYLENKTRERPVIDEEWGMARSEIEGLIDSLLVFD